MNMVSERKSRMSKPRPVTRVAAELQPVPVDGDYGDGGYSYVVGQDPRRHSMCYDIKASLLEPGLYYAATLFYGAADGSNDSFILSLDGKGQVKRRLVSFVDHLPNQFFVPEKLVEDSNRNVLCHGRLDTGDTKTVRLWRFTHEGKLDERFAGKGYVDNEELMLGTGVIVQLIPHTSGYLLIALKEQKPVLAALDHDGNLRRGFGSEGYVDLEAALNHPIIGAPGFALAALGQKILVTAVAVDIEHDYSVLASFNDDGTLDTGFANQGVFKAENGTYHYNLSTHAKSDVITLYGGHTDDYVIMYPEVLRLDASGKPLAAFNGGKPVRFATPGGWEHMHEFNKELVGYGGFYNHDRAVCYTLEGNLNTRFVPPDGFGELGVPAYRDGFRPTYEASIAWVPDTNRLLVAGQYLYNNQTSADAAIVAISYK